jgi:hypothetical protein
MNAVMHFQPSSPLAAPQGEWSAGFEGGEPPAAPGGGFSSLRLAPDDAALGSDLIRVCAELRSAKTKLDLTRMRRVVDQLVALTGLEAAAEELVCGTPLLPLEGRQKFLLATLLKRAGDICSPAHLAEAIGVRARSTRVVKVYVCQVRAELARHAWRT